MINFDAGPAALPKTVLQEASEAIIDYNHSGLSILEISHRGEAFKKILDETNHLAKKLMMLDDDYEILWIQGGGRLQFAMLPMNFLNDSDKVAYIDSGHWASEAQQTAALYGNTEIISSSKKDNYRYIPSCGTIDNQYAYVHITSNNTIYGTQWHEFPSSKSPLIADMSSDILSRNIDLNKFDFFYAVAQKNLGSTGVTMVAARKSFLEKSKKNLPDILSYKAYGAQNSLVNTAPVFAIYTCLLTLRWIDRKGLDTIEKENNDKADLLYNTIDNSTLFEAVADINSRSKMNVCFRAKEEYLTQKLISVALENNITGIKGHRSVGGFRVSLYNAISVDDVKKLISVMQHVESETSLHSNSSTVIH